AGTEGGGDYGRQPRIQGGPAPRIAAGSQPHDGPHVIAPSLPSPPQVHSDRDSSGIHSSTTPWRTSRSAFGRIAGTIALLVVLAGGGLFILNGGKGNAPGVGGGPTATVTFLDRGDSPHGRTDALQITAHGLVAPASGYHYRGWIVNNATERISALGVFEPSADGYTLNFKAGGNLLALGDKVEVTLEQGDGQVPIGRVILSGVFP